MDLKEAEYFLTDIKSVLSCKIVTNENNEIIEIHVLSDNSRHTKQIARDIRSALLSNYDIDVDYKVISVAQVNRQLAINTDYRLICNGYTNEIVSDHIKINVNLSWNDKEYTGEAEGIKSEKNILKLASTATLNAVKKAIGMDCFLTEDIQPTRLGVNEIILSAITHLDKNRENVLIGTSIVFNNRIESAIKSTLDAINRKVCLYANE